MRTEVIVTIIVQGFHYWENAGDNVDFLKCNHFHNFSIVAYKDVTILDREVEYFEFAERIRKFIGKRFPANTSSSVTAIDFGTMSCEQIAQTLVVELNLSACEVWEDQLFGSKVYA